MSVRLGIVGFGGMGHWHYDNASKIEGVDIVAVHDIDEKQLLDAEAQGIKSYHKLDDFLSDEEINTVLVSAPNPVHKELVIASAKAGKNIICEKPAALSVADFDEMVNCAQENKVIMTVHQNRRWDKDYNTAKAVIESGTIGEVFHISSRLYGIFGYVHDWHCYKKLGGGMMYDWGVHLIDQMLQLIPSRLVSVNADIRSVINSEVDDYFKLILRFENGAVTEIELGTYMLDILPRWYIAGDKGTAIINSFATDGKIYRTAKKVKKLPIRIADTTSGPTRTFIPTVPEDFIYDPLPEIKTDWTDFYRNFVDVLDGKAEQKIKLDEVRMVLSVMAAAVESSETGKEVNL
jgi:predicted dehydrogenase